MVKKLSDTRFHDFGVFLAVPLYGRIITQRDSKPIQDCSTHCVHSWLSLWSHFLYDFGELSLIFGWKQVFWPHLEHLVPMLATLKRDTDTIQVWFGHQMLILTTEIHYTTIRWSWDHCRTHTGHLAIPQTLWNGALPHVHSSIIDMLQKRSHKLAGESLWINCGS